MIVFYKNNEISYPYADGKREESELMKSLILWGWLLFLTLSISATEFLYPVARRDGILYVMYQKTPHHIELWEWDPQTRYAEQLLFSRFTPAGFRLLPSKEGFSFIDNGLLKVKKFFKRSPRIIEFDAPIYQVELVNWLDDTTCYASGRYQNHFGIFHIDYEGEVQPLCVKEAVDCMYPQKIDDTLFYIERDEQLHCRVMQTSYVPAPGENFNERLAWHYDQHQLFHEIACFETPVVFLSMVSAHEGFVIGHPSIVNRSNPIITFDYYHLIKQDSWQVQKLFSFSIPSALLFVGSPSRLYESLMPLLPQRYDHRIVFVQTINESLTISLYVYDQHTGLIEPIENSQGLFPPLAHISGGNLTDHRVGMSLEEGRGVKIDLVNVVF